MSEEPSKRIIRHFPPSISAVAKQAGGRYSWRVPTVPDSVAIMHPYSTSTDNRHQIVFWLAFVAIVVTPPMSSVVVTFGQTVGLQVDHPVGALIVQSVSAGAIFAVLHRLFNKVVWRFGPLPLLIGTPDISGEWEVEGKSAHPDPSDMLPWNGSTTVSQSWTRMLIVLKTANSTSRSECIISYFNGLGRQTYGTLKLHKVIQ